MLKILLIIFLILPGSFILMGALVGALIVVALLFLVAWAAYEYIRQEIRWQKVLRKRYTDPTN